MCRVRFVFDLVGKLGAEFLPRPALGKGTETRLPGGNFAAASKSALRRNIGCRAFSGSKPPPERYGISAGTPDGCPSGSGADGRFFHIFCGCQDFLRTKSQAIYLSRFGGPTLVAFEGDVNAAQHGLQGNACVPPGFHEHPVQRRQAQDSAPAALKVFLNFCEVIEIIFHGRLADGTWRKRRVIRHSLLSTAVTLTAGFSAAEFLPAVSIALIVVAPVAIKDLTKSSICLWMEYSPKSTLCARSCAPK